MSSEASAWVFQKSKHSGGALLVFVGIANHCHPDGTGGWPSIDTIAAYARMSRRGVQYIIKKLEDSGELVVTRTKRKGVGDTWTGRNEYSIPGVIRDGFFAQREPLADDESPESLDAKIAPPENIGRTLGEHEVQVGRTLGEHEVQTEVRPIPKPNVKPKLTTTETSKSSKPEFNYKAFQSRYYKLVGATPKKYDSSVKMYEDLCRDYGEERVLDCLSEWVDAEGGRKKLFREPYGPKNFLENAEIMLTTTRKGDTEDKEASYPHGLVESAESIAHRKKYPRTSEE